MPAVVMVAKLQHRDDGVKGEIDACEGEGSHHIYARKYGTAAGKGAGVGAGQCPAVGCACAEDGLTAARAAAASSPVVG